MTIYGITGQTGAGKSTVLGVFASMGAYILDCDRVYWEILESDTALQGELCEAFGDISAESGVIDRKKLGAVVFSSTESLELLNEITHPYVLAKVEEKIKEAKAASYEIVAIDAISLIESGLAHGCHYVFAVVSPEETRIKRIMTRDGISYDYARNRAKAQKNEAFYQENANAVLNNHSDQKDDFEKYVQSFLKKYV
ncbi:MAG: dephospho-CoA kinase [Eubacteriales bacterium]